MVAVVEWPTQKPQRFPGFYRALGLGPGAEVLAENPAQSMPSITPAAKPLVQFAFAFWVLGLYGLGLLGLIRFIGFLGHIGFVGFSAVSDKT